MKLLHRISFHASFMARILDRPAVLLPNNMVYIYSERVRKRLTIPANRQNNYVF